MPSDCSDVSPLYRWCSLLLLAGRKGKGEVQTEIVKSALLRGRMCDAVVAAILERTGAGGTILKAVQAYEKAEWDRAEDELSAIGADPGTLSDVYLDSVTWAGNRMPVHQE